VLADVDSLGDHPSGCRDVRGCGVQSRYLVTWGVAGDPLEQRPGVVEHRQTQQEVAVPAMRFRLCSRPI